MVYNSISQYLDALQKYLEPRCRIIEGKGFILVKDNWIDFKEYATHNTKPTYEPLPAQNSDGRAIPGSVKVRKDREIKSKK